MEKFYRNRIYYNEKIGNNLKNKFTILSRKGLEMVGLAMNSTTAVRDVCFKLKNSDMGEDYTRRRKGIVHPGNEAVAVK